MSFRETKLNIGNTFDQKWELASQQAKEKKKEEEGGTL